MKIVYLPSGETQASVLVSAPTESFGDALRDARQRGDVLAEVYLAARQGAHPWAQLIEKFDDALKEAEIKLRDQESEYEGLVKYLDANPRPPTENLDSASIIDALEELPIERAKFEAISNQVAELDTQANRENRKSLYTRLQTLLDSPANFPDRESSPDSLIEFSKTWVDQQLRTVDSRRIALEKLLQQADAEQSHSKMMQSAQQLRAAIERSKTLIDTLVKQRNAIMPANVRESDGP